MVHGGDEQAKTAVAVPLATSCLLVRSSSDSADTLTPVLDDACRRPGRSSVIDAPHLREDGRRRPLRSPVGRHQIPTVPPLSLHNSTCAREHGHDV